MYNLFLKNHEINAVNLTSTKPPTPSREAVSTPQANTVQQMGEGKEMKKNCSHARADLIINLIITKIILISRQYKQNTIILVT